MGLHVTYCHANVTHNGFAADRLTAGDMTMLFCPGLTTSFSFCLTDLVGDVILMVLGWGFFVCFCLFGCCWLLVFGGFFLGYFLLNYYYYLFVFVVVEDGVCCCFLLLFVFWLCFCCLLVCFLFVCCCFFLFFSFSFFLNVRQLNIILTF